MDSKLIGLGAGTALGAGSGVVSNAKLDRGLKQLPNESDEEFRQRRRSNLIKAVGSGALSLGLAGYNIGGNNYGAGLGSVIGSLTGAGIGSGMTTTESFANMDAEEQQRMLNRARLGEAVGSVGGTAVGRLSQHKFK